MASDDVLWQQDSGTGARFASAVIIVAGVAALVASLVTFVSVPAIPS
jgi:hypothetical protein